MLDAKYLTAVFLFWQMVHYLSRRLTTHVLQHPRVRARLPHAKPRAALLRQAPAYLVSTLHALYVSPRGLLHLVRLFRAPLSLKLVCPRLGQHLPLWQLPYAREIDRVMWTNLVLAGYLCADLCHVLAHFPVLGGADTVLHHLAFLVCAVVAGWYRLYPFMFGWLILGEASTPLLNLRWLLINTGYGSTTFFSVVQTLFALVFIATRFFLFSLGLAYQFTMLDNVPDFVPTWAVFVTMAVVVTGYLLNLVWLRKIVRLATGTATPRESNTINNINNINNN